MQLLRCSMSSAGCNDDRYLKAAGVLRTFSQPSRLKF